MILLTADTPRDQEIIEKFQRAYENLKKIVDKQNEKIRELEDQIKEYKKRHPSNIGIKNGKPYVISQAETIPEPEDSHIHGSTDEIKKRPGAQPGHKGYFRIRKRPTRRIRINLDIHQCPECNSSLRRKGTRKRIIEDILIIKTDIIEYKMNRLCCNKCHRIYEPEIPDALCGTTLSIRTMLTVAYFRIGMRMSIENVSSTMMNVFGIHISEGEIQHILSQLSDSLGYEYTSLLQTIRDAPSRHMDSTSWRINGNPYNLWAFLTKSESIFAIRKSNGHEVPLEMLADHKGIDIHDRHSALETFASKSKNDQQYFWSHIICDGKELEEFYGEEGGRIKKGLQTIYDEAKEYHGHGTMKDVKKLHHDLTFLLTSHYEHKRSQRFVENLLKRKKEWLLQFVMNSNVEPMNNRAERGLRPPVIYRKTSGGSRSERGAEIYTKIYSIYYTSKLRGKNFISDAPSVMKRMAIPG